MKSASLCNSISACCKKTFYLLKYNNSGSLFHSSVIPATSQVKSNRLLLEVLLKTFGYTCICSFSVLFCLQSTFFTNFVHGCYTSILLPFVCMFLMRFEFSLLLAEQSADIAHSLDFHTSYVNYIWHIVRTYVH